MSRQRKTQHSRPVTDSLKDTASAFAANLTRIREFRGLTIEQLAEATSIPVDVLTEFEEMKSTYTRESMEALTKALNVDWAQLSNQYGGPFYLRRSPDQPKRITYTKLAVQAEEVCIASKEEYDTYLEATNLLLDKSIGLAEKAVGAGKEAANETKSLREENAALREQLATERAAHEKAEKLRTETDEKIERLSGELAEQHELNTRLRKDLLAANDRAHELSGLLTIIRKTAKQAKQ